jgi:hypothetical protein
LHRPQFDRRGGADARKARFSARACKAIGNACVVLKELTTATRSVILGRGPFCSRTHTLEPSADDEQIVLYAFLRRSDHLSDCLYFIQPEKV